MNKIARANEIGKEGVGSVRTLPGNMICELVAVMHERRPGDFCLVEGSVPIVEIIGMAKREEARGLERLGYCLRKKPLMERRTEDDPYAILEIWKVQKKLVIEVFRALVNLRGEIRLYPVVIRERKLIVLFKMISMEITDNETDLSWLLNPRIVIDAIPKEAPKKFGVEIFTGADFPIYRKIIQEKDGNHTLERWLIMIPTPGDCWRETGDLQVQPIEVDPDRLTVFRDSALIDPVTYEMALVAMAAANANGEEIQAADNRLIARRCLSELNGANGSQKGILDKDGQNAIIQFRNELDLE